MHDYPAEAATIQRAAVATHAQGIVRDEPDYMAGSLPWQIAQLERLTGELADTVEVLETRLRPVLRDADDGVDPEPPSPTPTSTHAGNLSSIGDRTSRTLRHLRAIIDRVDA